MGVGDYERGLFGVVLRLAHDPRRVFGTSLTLSHRKVALPARRRLFHPLPRDKGVSDAVKDLDFSRSAERRANMDPFLIGSRQELGNLHSVF
jgi:hypothetical protein